MVPTHLHGARVLIGEHNPTIRARLHDALWFHGAEVAEASTGRELLARLVDEGPFDAVVSDSTMPSPCCSEMIAMARAAGLEVVFLVLTHTTDRAPICPRRDVSVVSEPLDEAVVVAELDRILATPHRLDIAKCVFVACTEHAAIPTSPRSGRRESRSVSRAPRYARPPTSRISNTAVATDRCGTSPRTAHRCRHLQVIDGGRDRATRPIHCFSAWTNDS